ncbi:MAG: M48 family metalloprotease [Planctomycetota bacterium]|nr:M48 family metalloprotease [Planctomycetota bacterium]
MPDERDGHVLPEGPHGGQAAMTDSTLNVQAGFKRPWRPVWRGPLYRLSLLAVSVMMLIIPLCYVAFIVGIGYAAWWHAVHDYTMVTSVFSHTRGRGSIYALLLAGVAYVAPIIAALLLLYILLRPLMPQSREDVNSYTVHPNEEPELYAFVGALCTYIGAPVPKRIDIDATPNASARFDRGLVSVLIPGDLVLTIGLPLMHGMNLNQFAGVLAHEFGHFSQGAGMRAGMLINRINSWVAGVVYDDGRAVGMVDDLEAHEAGFIGAIFALFLKLSIKLTQAVFWVLFWSAHLLSSAMSRQMEFDADRHQARFSGAETFTSTFRRLMELNEGFMMVTAELPEYWKNGKRLPDNIPALINDAAQRLSPEARDRVEHELTRRGTGWFSTHPAVSRRIAAVKAKGEEGVFDLAVPAISLLRVPRDVSVRATYGYYRERLGRRFDDATMVPTEGVLTANRDHDKAVAQARQATGFEAPTWRPLFLGVSEFLPCQDAKAVYEKLRASREQLGRMGQKASAAAEAYRRQDEELLALDLAQSWFETGHTTLPRGFACPVNNRHSIFEVRSRLINECAQSAGTVDEALEHAASRVVCSLRLLHTKGVESRVPNASVLRTRTSELVKVQGALRDCLPSMRELRKQMGQAGLTATLLENTKRREEAIRVLTRIARDAYEQLIQVRNAVEQMPYPFESPRERRLTLLEHLVEVMPVPDDPESILNACGQVLERYPVVAHKVTAELAAAGLSVEQALARKAPAASGAGGPSRTASENTSA